MLLPGQIGNSLFRRFRFCRDPNSAGTGKRDIGTVRIKNLAASPAHKLIDIAGVVGKQNEGLKMFNRRTGIVP
ncbi:Uncharacterised protein [Salmonella enterica subsp. enterica serovar Bovismorbificans]|uniref:Uncharacterized protein n=1 Tax=Salmonella enterica subsp. enterica serovar Bovismorbificans TaxID=58097 RepID=A0A655D4F1_SALET|nr:Uncharacterised protein [Salmonella enterica subsp. enterica serovar Bovismorbificans]CPR73339.1 Uncharacterised protein [Salmonella enterica subsp. enterica serovar Bovismorbificans]